jgi:hypothetical protein
MSYRYLFYVKTKPTETYENIVQKPRQVWDKRVKERRKNGTFAVKYTMRIKQWAVQIGDILTPVICSVEL